ncbi:hypothetical protein V7S43_013779 [Phytophthora oleae]|uniref:Uncharacterized protein n=1 Tax=Phytophthora oleae TaxID=2107226 RepID=A0ABD3F2X5_9STRA
MVAVGELVKEGQRTANGVIKKATQTERHYELPAVLVAYLQSISAASTVSLQTAEKARSAVASYYSSHENSDGTDVNKWSVAEDEDGCKRGYENPARDPFVQQFMRRLKKRKASEYVQAKAVPISLEMLGVLHTFLDSQALESNWKDVSLRQTRFSTVAPDEVIEFGTYTLFNRKTEVAEGRAYNLHHLSPDEDSINAYKHLCTWVDYATKQRGHKWNDDDFVFSALTGISRKALKDDGVATGCEKVAIGWGKKMGEQTFITLLNCVVNALNRQGQTTTGYVAKNWYNGWFTSHAFRRAEAQYRFMYAQPARRWSCE